jgi:signal transduction histidine kinase
MAFEQLSADKIQSDQLASVSSTFLSLRPKLLLPATPFLVLLLNDAGVSSLQLLALALNFALMLGFFCWEAWRVRQRRTTPTAFARSLVVTLLGLASLCGLSGGPQSPFVPILFAPVGIAFAAFGVSQSTRNVLVALVLGVAYLAASVLLFPWPPIPVPHLHAVLIMNIAMSTTLLYFGVTGLAAAYRATANQLEAMRLEVIHGAALRAAELESVGASVAHEIKNPLASIKGLVQLVHGASADTERSRLRLGVVLDEVARVERVLHAYLTFSRPLADLNRAPVPLAKFISDFAELLSGQALRCNVVMAVSCPEFTVRIDADKLKQALLNLAQNALHAMPEGGRLTLSVCHDDESFEISLSDTGHGMSSRELMKAKEPYYTSRPGGTGLGVVIADGIVRQHGGRLLLESEVGVGTTARLQLPKSRS